MLLSSVNSDYNNDLHSWKEIERQVLNIARAGFTHTQWIHDWDGEYLYSPRCSRCGTCSGAAE